MSAQKKVLVTGKNSFKLPLESLLAILLETNKIHRVPPISKKLHFLCLVLEFQESIT
jgi:hypothetical protein